ncbi:metallophosphoesterase [Prosthecobacter fluviatilis]|uniref:Metallophosphoesterase n=1 Tax=Prosthecobacter fluviatilis TaxID=445931 RepID=A0ABW0KRE2_9BACT
MKTQPYDLIGDIHGQHDKLTNLLGKLGYLPYGSGFRHPEGRKVIFLGDYIDRGPKVREVLLTVRGMVEVGDALAIMGNHEYNAVCYHTPDGKGGWLREHCEEKNRQVTATLRAFEGRETEWADWLEWMKRLPMFLDLGALRCVHACWDTRRIKRLMGHSVADPAFLRTSATSLTPEHRAIENVLKGPEIPATDGNLFHDKDGTFRNTIRARWWDIRKGLTVSDLVMPPGSMSDSMKVDPWVLNRLPNYEPEEPPVFFGHYWLPANAPKAPQAPNIACLDFSGGLDGPLVAYRWDGEKTLNAEKFAISDLN